MYEGIKKYFCSKFGVWEITIDEKDLFLGNKQMIATRDWRLKWAMQENDNGPYIEYYGINRRRGHLHGRIYEDGKEESLQVLREYIAYSPNILGDRERSTKEFEEYNKRLMEELREKGLL